MSNVRLSDPLIVNPATGNAGTTPVRPGFSSQSPRFSWFTAWLMHGCCCAHPIPQPALQAKQ